MDTPYVREYIEDREVTCWLLLDRTASMGFGPIDRQKSLVLAEVAATLAQVLSRGGNRIGAVLFDGGIETIPPAQGRNQVLRITQALLRPPPPAPTPPNRPVAVGGEGRRRPRARRRPGPRISRRCCGRPWAWPGAARCSSSCPTSSPSRGGRSTCPCWPAATTSSPSRCVDPRESELPAVGDGLRRGRRDRRADLRRHRRRGVPRAPAHPGRRTPGVRSRQRPARPAPRSTPWPPTTTSSAPWCASPSCASSSSDELHLAVDAARPRCAVPLLVVAYRAQQRRRDARRDELAAIGLVPVGGIPGPDGSPHAATVSGAAAPPRPRRDRLRHLAPVLMLAALTVLLVSLARPTASVAEPRREGTVVLAFDISTSMARQGHRLPPGWRRPRRRHARSWSASRRTIRIGVVAFGDSALVSQQPTEDRTQVLGCDQPPHPAGRPRRWDAASCRRSSAIAGKPIEVGSRAGDGRPGRHRLLPLRGDRAALRRREHHRPGPPRDRATWPRQPG